ncbi:phospholipase effector Tle1 domain-containing protein [Chryseobacterium sp. JK1]|uniref:phospholipase effector Tle1 domain-containing protein n=1 Tax=Chryseobacterium sp. JK1 TaxID=874294 RepID=UPI003D68747E
MSNIVFGNYSPPPPPKGEINIRIGIFFDGTQNNRSNTKAGGNEPDYKRTEEEKKKYDKYSNKDDDSYENDLSNVARKEYWYNTEDYVAKIYIEGIGTENLKADSDDLTDHLGVAFGAGSMGIRAKVRKGCEEIVKKVIELKKDKRVNTLTLDVFGFSRGAAAARNFVYEINKSKYYPLSYVPPVQGAKAVPTDSDGYYTALKELPGRGHLGLKLQEQKINIETISVRVLGLYDTVSSYDPNATNKTISPDFTNDVEELHLNTLKAKKIIHFCASDEHRENFMITLTRNAGGNDFFLPGVHSDVGGCYTHNMKELNRQIMDLDNTWGDGLSDSDYDKILNNDLNDLIEQGWFKRSEVVAPNSWHETHINRQGISNRYSFVTLQLLTEMINETYEGTFNLAKIAENYKIPNGTENKYYPLDLTKVKTRLQEYIKGTKPKMSYYTNKEIEAFRKQWEQKKMTTEKFNTIVNDHNMLMDLRNRYIHWNSRFGEIGYRPNYTLDKKNLKVTRWRRIAPNS